MRALLKQNRKREVKIGYLMLSTIDQGSSGPVLHHSSPNLSLHYVCCPILIVHLKICALATLIQSLPSVTICSRIVKQVSGHQKW